MVRSTRGTPRSLRGTRDKRPCQKLYDDLSTGEGPWLSRRKPSPCALVLKLGFRVVERGFPLLLRRRIRGGRELVSRCVEGLKRQLCSHPFVFGGQKRVIL